MSRQKIDECKDLYRNILKGIKANDDEKLLEMVNEYAKSEDVHILRMLLVAIKPIRDEELFRPIHDEVLNKLQKKLNSIIY